MRVEAGVGHRQRAVEKARVTLEPRRPGQLPEENEMARGVRPLGRTDGAVDRGRYGGRRRLEVVRRVVVSRRSAGQQGGYQRAGNERQRT